MNNTSTTNSAQALANQFKVAELEPRLENAWGEPTEHQEPTCIGAGNCAEAL